MVHLYAATATAMALNATTTEQISESGENVSQIQSLAARAQDLTQSVSVWNNAYVILVALTALLAAGLFITQFVVIRKGRDLETVLGKLTAARDAKAASDSQDKDVKIAQLSLRIEEERRKRAEAEESLAALTKRLRSRSDVFDQAAFVSALSGKPKGIAACLFQTNDPEAQEFSMDIYRALLAADWTSAIPQPLSLLGDTGGAAEFLAAGGGATGGSGISLVAESIAGCRGDATPFMALHDAFEASGLGFLPMSVGPKLPQPVIRIIVGPSRP